MRRCISSTQGSLERKDLSQLFVLPFFFQFNLVFIRWIKERDVAWVFWSVADNIFLSWRWATKYHSCYSERFHLFYNWCQWHSLSVVKWAAFTVAAFLVCVQNCMTLANLLMVADSVAGRHQEQGSRTKHSRTLCTSECSSGIMFKCCLYGPQRDLSKIYQHTNKAHPADSTNICVYAKVVQLSPQTINIRIRMSMIKWLLWKQKTRQINDS